KVSSFEEHARKRGVMIISECGLDPGIDHMSAMEIIDRLRFEGATITAFKSYTGGLVAPESNNNPWGYKFSWNPRNVILAGQATACFIADGNYRYVPYSRIFSEIETISVPGHGAFDGYANRDSLSYRNSYGLHHIPTMVRGTLRQRGYCRAWNVFVALGLTDDQVRIHDAGSMTYRQLVESFIPSSIKGETVEERVARLCGLPVDGEAMSMVTWTGIFDDTIIPMDQATPAQILQHLLEQKWRLMPEDRDMIVMYHEFEYVVDESKKRITSSLVVEGEDSVMTAMAKTVGLPMAITALKIIDGSIKLPGGNHIPVSKEIYVPVLKSLASMGIVFKETST
ncbi:MAG: saccharopine dehydrogenase C-terminal domain-containing protein, partial [Bacteroidota bacterium]